MQRVVDLKEKFGKLLSEGALEDLSKIQSLLANQKQVNEYLSILELELEQMIVKAWEEKDARGSKPTCALDRVLAKTENLWALKPRFTIGSQLGQVPVEDFIKIVSEVQPLKDSGAVVGHGEYAHRLQWYIIAQHFLVKKKDKLHLSLAKIHQILGSKELITFVGEDKFEVSLWDEVLDVRGSFVDSEEKSMAAYKDVYAASPVKLTGALSWDSKGTPGALVLDHPNLARAVGNRRRKRFHQSKKESPGSWETREKWIEQKFSGLL